MQLNIIKLNKLFEESKYSKRELAKRCGFTRPTLDGLLQGADVKISTLIALATFFDRPISYFFDEDTNVEYTQHDTTNSFQGTNSGSVQIHDNRGGSAQTATSELEHENAELKRKLIAAQERIIELMDRR